MIRHFCNLLLLLFPPTRLFWIRNRLLQFAGVKIHPTARLCGRSWIYGRGELYIGANAWISPGATIHTHLDAQITIGDRCDIGPSVELHPGSHLHGDANRRAGPGVAAPINIGNGCWLGARVLVLGGVSIGEGAMVAAGSVVTQDIPPHTLVAGVPARVKRELPK